MRRLTLLLAGGAVWLFLAAVPVFADGGPHIASLNSGTTGINADSCAACHRAHTAQASYLLLEEQPAMCIVCHGDAGLGAATNVESGLQYVLDGNGSRTTSVLGALRAGGFETARIASNAAYSVAYYRNASNEISFRTKVPVASTGQPVTSAHMPITGPGEGTAWGNGALNSGPGPDVEMECTTCHNPHGNGNYRILNPVPNPSEVATTGVQFVATTGAAIVLDDSASANVTRNYTVIQTLGGTGTLTAAQVQALGLAPTAGDYFRRTVPWDPQVAYNAVPPNNVTANDAPNGIPGTFTTQMAAWCITCHSRYASAGWAVNTQDNIFKYRHTSQSTSRNCVTCHVSHGSNAVMNGWNSTHSAYPNADGTGGTYEPFTTTANTSSRLLKIDNRGTCQACHDPTGTVVAAQVRPTGASAPVPYVP